MKDDLIRRKDVEYVVQNREYDLSNPTQSRLMLNAIDNIPSANNGRECDKCLWAQRSGGCASWNCEFVDKREAYEAWLNSKDKVYIPDVYKVANVGDKNR